MVDFVFLAMDWFGAFFSLLALGTRADIFCRRSNIDIVKLRSTPLMYSEAFFIL